MEERTLRTNEDKLVVQSVWGRAHHPIVKQSIYRIGTDGVPHILPAHGGITYNFQIGDSCMGLAGDHIEPGVSTKNPNELEDIAYNNLCCIGNQAKLITGDAKGEIGYVTGKHGGIEHVMVYFGQGTLEKMNLDDKMIVKACGQGLKLLDFPEVKCLNLSPFLFHKMNLRVENNKLIVPVAAVAPSYVMGSGLGKASLTNGDYDIMTRDPEAYEKYHMADFRFGDIVAILDHQGCFGPDYLEGAVSIGVIIHSDSYKAGHGPGVTLLMTTPVKDILVPELDSNANLKNYFPNL